MKNLYWFTNEEGENILDDYYGTEEDAIKYAGNAHEKLKCAIYINCGEDIIDVLF